MGCKMLAACCRCCGRMAAWPDWRKFACAGPEKTGTGASLPPLTRRWSFLAPCQRFERNKIARLGGLGLALAARSRMAWACTMHMIRARRDIRFAKRGRSGRMNAAKPVIGSAPVLPGMLALASCSTDSHGAARSACGSRSPAATGMQPHRSTVLGHGSSTR